MEDRVPGVSLRSEQQSSQHSSQQTLINAVIYVFTLLEHSSIRTNKCKDLYQKACILFLDKKNQSTITRFHFGLQYKPPRVVTPVTHSCCSKRPWDVDISLQRHRNVAHAKPNIHPPLSLCKITPRSVGKIGKPSLSCSDCLVTPEYITVYFTLMHEEEHYPKSKWVVWFRLSHLIKGLKSN